MAIVLLAHSDPHQRESLAAKLGAKGFSVKPVSDVESALDAAEGAIALLVDPPLLLQEEMEVKTRLDLRAGRAVRILALTHRASAEEMAAFRRHGAGLLARPVEDVERLATMLRLQVTEDAPWEPERKKPAAPAKPAPAEWARMPPLPAPSTVPWDAKPSKSEEKAAKAEAKAKAKAEAKARAEAEAEARAEAEAKAKEEKRRQQARALEEAAEKAQQKAEKQKDKKKKRWWGKDETGEEPIPTALTKVPPVPSPPPAPLAARPKTPPPPPAPAKSPWEAEDDELYGEPPAAPANATEAKPLSPPDAQPLFADVEEERTSEQSIADFPMRTRVSPAAAPPAPPPPPAAVRPKTPPAVAPPPPPAAVRPKTPPPAAPPPVARPKTPPPVPAAAPLPPPWQTTNRSDATMRDVPAAAPPPRPPPPPRIDDPSLLDPPSSFFDTPTSESADLSEHTVVSPGDDEATIASAAEEISRETRVSVGQIPPETRTAVSPIPSETRTSLSQLPPIENLTEPTVASGTDAEATVFTPELPDQVPDAPPELEGWDTAIANAVNAEGPSVLVVDDEASFRGFLRDALAERGYRVHTAINASNALRFLKTNAGVDLVISDLNMPHMDGFELKHEIDQVTGRAMPFIIVTADTSEEKIQTAAQVGASALVPKPIEDLEAFHAIVLDTLRDAGVISR